MHYKTPVRCRMGLLCKGIQSNRHPWEKHSINKDGGQNCLSVALCTGGLIPGGTIPYHRNVRERIRAREKSRGSCFIPAQKTPQETLSGAQERTQESNTTRTTSARAKPVRQEQTMHALQTPDAPPSYISFFYLFI